MISPPSWPRLYLPHGNFLFDRVQDRQYLKSSFWLTRSSHAASWQFLFIRSSQSIRAVVCFKYNQDTRSPNGGPCSFQIRWESDVPIQTISMLHDLESYLVLLGNRNRFRSSLPSSAFMWRHNKSWEWRLACVNWPLADKRPQIKLEHRLNVMNARRDRICEPRDPKGPLYLWWKEDWLEKISLGDKKFIRYRRKAACVSTNPLYSCEYNRLCHSSSGWV